MFISVPMRLATFLALYTRVWWRGPDLTRKLAAAASAAVVLILGFIAAVSASHVRDAIVHRAAAATALYMDSFIAPHVQELATDSALSQASREALDNLFAPTAIGKPVVGFRIWVGDRIIFSNHRTMIGRQFAHSPARNHAWGGNVSAELDSLDGDDDIEMLALNTPILEVYAPVRQGRTRRIIALAETYEIATDLNRDVRMAQLLIWIVFASVAWGTVWTLFGLAARGTREVSRLHCENAQYRTRVGGAGRRVSELNELHMRRIGTELYDGPMQLVALALLKLDSLRELIPKSDIGTYPRIGDVETVREALNKTLADIRALSASLVPSKIKKVSLAETIIEATRRHERRASTPVALKIGTLPRGVSFSAKACLYRFVENGLDSCCTKGQLQAVMATSDGEELRVQIIGSPRASTTVGCVEGEDQKLCNLRDQVEALGGAFQIDFDKELILITAKFSLCDVEIADFPEVRGNAIRQ